MAESKFDLPDDLLSSKPSDHSSTRKGNDDDKSFLVSIDDSKDQAVVDSNMVNEGGDKEILDIHEPTELQKQQLYDYAEDEHIQENTNNAIRAEDLSLRKMENLKAGTKRGKTGQSVNPSGPNKE